MGYGAGRLSTGGSTAGDVGKREKSKLGTPPGVPGATENMLPASPPNIVDGAMLLLIG